MLNIVAHKFIYDCYISEAPNIQPIHHITSIHFIK